MEEWPDANCLMLLYQRMGFPWWPCHTLFISRLFHPQSRQTAGVSIEHVGEKVLGNQRSKSTEFPDQEAYFGVLSPSWPWLSFACRLEQPCKDVCARK